MNKIFSALLLAAAFLVSGVPCTAAVPASAPEQREQSIKDMDKLLDKRLFKQAAEQALKQLNEYDDQYSGKDLALYYRALQNLNALNDSTNLDTILQEQMKRHGENPWFLMAAAELYQTASHTFKLADGKYIRVNRSWEGEYSGQKRDKVEALRCLLKAMNIAERNKDMKLLGLARFMMAKAFLKNYDDYRSSPSFQTYAALANLTGLDKLPGYVSNQEASELRTLSPLRENRKSFSTTPPHPGIRRGTTANAYAGCWTPPSGRTRNWQTRSICLRHPGAVTCFPTRIRSRTRNSCTVRAMQARWRASTPRI